MTPNPETLQDVLHFLINQARWFTESARDAAHAIVDADGRPAPAKKTAKKPPADDA